jgi:hypothetical protein
VFTGTSEAQSIFISHIQKHQGCLILLPGVFFYFTRDLPDAKIDRNAKNLPVTVFSGQAGNLAVVHPAWYLIFKQEPCK